MIERMRKKMKGTGEVVQLISEYGRADCSEKAYRVFLELLEYGLEPNDYTLTNVLSTCNEDRDVMEGRQLHGVAVKQGLVDKTLVGNAVTTMYGKHGLVDEAERMFHEMDGRNLITWTALLSVLMRNGNAERAVVRYNGIKENILYSIGS